jgi:predicted tellurium resistance membrane protein TerC
MDRFPLVIVLGAGLLGWIGGSMLVDDVIIRPYTTDFGAWSHYGSAISGALLVIALGKWLALRKAPTTPASEKPLDLAHKDSSGEP